MRIRIVGRHEFMDAASAGRSPEDATGAAGQPAVRPRSPFRIRLFDPAPQFRLISAWFSFFRGAAILVWPGVALAVIAAAFNWYELLAHTDRVLFSISFLQKIVISMLTANLFSKIVMGAAMSHHRADTNEFGIRLMLGVFPRFYIATGPIRRLDFRRQRACYAAPLLMKLFLFSAGILLWTVLARSGSGAADAALALGAVGLGSFLFTANPLWPADGYRWFSAYLERPKLRSHAFRMLKMRLTGKPMPAALSRGEAWALSAYSLLTVAFTAFLAFTVFTSVAYALEAQFRGAGVVIFSVLLALVTLFLLSLRSGKSRGDGDRAVYRHEPRGRTRPQSVPERATGDLVIAGRPAGETTAYGDDPMGDEQVPFKRLAGAVGKDRARNASGPKPRRKPDADPLEEVLSSDAETSGLAPGSPHSDLDALLSADIVPIAGPETDENALERILAPEPEGASGDMPRGSSGEPNDPGASSGEPPHAFADPGSAATEVRPSAELLPAPVGRRRRPRMNDPDPSRALQPLEGEGRALATREAEPTELDSVLRMGPAARPPMNKWRKRAIWAALLAAIAYVLMLPYPFEVGGEFIVQPLERAQVRARTDGEIIEVRVREGDWVDNGEIMAVLSNWDEKRDIAVREAEIAKLEAELETLLLGPRPEEVVVAEQNVASAELQVEIAAQDLSRQEQLFSSGTISAKALEDARSRYQTAEAAREEAKAALALVSSTARESEIEAARAGIARNREDLAFARLQLEHTNIRAAVGGQVVSSLAEVPVGAFLPEGGLFAELEDNRTVIAEIEVPETEIEEVEIGAVVELKLWSAPKESIFGTVQRVAPKAEEREFGRVMRVLVEVPNPDNELSANMTGFGKVAAAERPVWEAFTRVFVRFFRVEIWSWLP